MLLDIRTERGRKCAIDVFANVLLHAFAIQRRHLLPFCAVPTRLRPATECERLCPSAIKDATASAVQSRSILLTRIVKASPCAIRTPFTRTGSPTIDRMLLGWMEPPS